MGIQRVPQAMHRAWASGYERGKEDRHQEQTHQVSSRSWTRLGAPREQSDPRPLGLALTARCPTMAIASPSPQARKPGPREAETAPTSPLSHWAWPGLPAALSELLGHWGVWRVCDTAGLWALLTRPGRGNCPCQEEAGGRNSRGELVSWQVQRPPGQPSPPGLGDAHRLPLDTVGAGHCAPPSCLGLHPGHARPSGSFHAPVHKGWTPGPPALAAPLVGWARQREFTHLPQQPPTPLPCTSAWEPLGTVPKEPTSPGCHVQGPRVSRAPGVRSPGPEAGADSPPDPFQPPEMPAWQSPQHSLRTGRAQAQQGQRSDTQPGPEGPRGRVPSR